MKRLLKRALGRRILTGPFKSMRFLGYASTSVLMPKILGTYEMELYPIISSLLPTMNGTVIVVGSGEGFYSVGLLTRNPWIRVQSFELNDEARAAQLRLAQMNGVSTRLEIKGACTPDALTAQLRHGPADLLFVDVEGYESVLLDPETIPMLARQRMIVEVHDSIDPSLSALMHHRFDATHDIQTVPCLDRRPDDIRLPGYRWLAHVSPRIARTLLWERMPNTGWMVLTPKCSSRRF